MAKIVFGFFKRPDQVKRAMKQLIRTGSRESDLRVLTSEPYHEHEFLTRSSFPLSMISIFGGILGGLSGVALAVYTFKVVGLPTGGMPMVSYAPTGIITFALTGLGAIAGTLIATLRAAGLPDFKGEFYDRELAHDLAIDGFLTAVRCEKEDKIRQAEQVFKDAGAVKVKIK